MTDSEISAKLKGMEGWKRAGKFIVKTFEFKEFMDGIRFLSRVANVAEKLEHHPDFSVRYTTIKVSIQTHSVGGLTTWDFDLARAIDRVVGDS
jgi:4a-hydroxytetrahydrobiopterin dehydratase